MIIMRDSEGRRESVREESNEKGKDGRGKCEGNIYRNI